MRPAVAGVRGAGGRARWRAAMDFVIARGALVALAAFAVAGIAVFDDYGVSVDEDLQRLAGQAAIDYALGDGGALPTDFLRYYGVTFEALRYYGVAFEAPLVLVERLLGLTDSRAVYLNRHLLTHLFFLTGGYFCYLLAYRLFGDRRLALFALLLFLLHPRLYAHSFFNSKDIPFLAMFMIALYLVQRAFGRDTVAAFALCGVGVGVLVNLRVMGVMLFVAVAALRALDLAQARGRAERRRALGTAAVFVLTAAGTLYTVSPYLWLDPFAIVEAFATLARNPTRAFTLFQGEPVRGPSIPPHYLPTWMAITTPPATLLLSLIGAAAVIRRGGACPGSVLRNTGVRFALLLLACLALPPAAVIALNSNLSGGWRYLYFLYAPLCLLAVYGLRALLSAAQQPWLKRGAWLMGGAWLRRGLCVLAAAALAGMATDVVRLHPYQQAYFNFLVDRRTPERLSTRYQMLYWETEYREGLEYLLARYPDSTLYVDSPHSGNVRRQRLILPAAARRRIVIADEAGRAADFFIVSNSRLVTNHRLFGRTEPPFGPVLYARRIYRNTVLAVTAVDLSLVDAATADGYRAAYRAAVAGEPLFRSEFDLYLDGRTLTWVKESCRPEDTVHPFVLRAVPVAVDHLPAYHREEGWEPLGFRFGHYGVHFDGRCLIRRRLPDYPLRTLEVGRWVPGAGSLLEAAIDLPAAGPSVSRYWQAVAAGERGAPAATAVFDLYLERGATGPVLTYHREPCAAADLRARFFLHLFPVDARELAAQDRPHGFDNLDFDFGEHGVLLGAACVALVRLPDYDRGIARLRTGQFISGEGQLWKAEIASR